MDRSEFRTAARELLQRHLTEQYPESKRSDDALYRRGYVQGMGDYVSETTVARKNDAMINRDYYKHQRHEQQSRQIDEDRTVTARADLDQHIQNAGRTPVDREDLKRQFKETAREVTGREDGPPRTPGGDRERGPGSGPEPRSRGGDREHEPSGGPSRTPPTAAVAARNPETTRAALNQHIERTENRKESPQASRDALQQHVEGSNRGQVPEKNRDINPTRGRER